MRNHHKTNEPRHSQPSQQLRDMRAVYKGVAPSDNETPGMKAVREMFEKDRAKFLAQLNQMEKEYQTKKLAYNKRRGSTDGGSGTKPVGGPKEVDQGTERLHEIIDRILTESTSDVSRPSVRSASD